MKVSLLDKEYRYLVETKARNILVPQCYLLRTYLEPIESIEFLGLSYKLLSIYIDDLIDYYGQKTHN